MEAAIQDLARMLEASPFDGVALPEAEIQVIYEDLDDPWFVDDDSVVVTTDDAHLLDRSLRMQAAVLAVA